MATFQITNGLFSPTTKVCKAPGGVVTVFPNNAGVTVYYWHQKADGSWHSTDSLFTNGLTNSGVLTSNVKNPLGTIQATATGTYGFNTSGTAPTDGQDPSTGEINIGSEDDEPGGS